MERTPVTSSNIKAIGYDSETKDLSIEFRYGSIYTYNDVTPEEHKALMAAPSIGGHFRAHIKGKPFQRM